MCCITNHEHLFENFQVLPYLISNIILLHKLPRHLNKTNLVNLSVVLL